jgi:hypothetical protein
MHEQYKSEFGCLEKHEARNRESYLVLIMFLQTSSRADGLVPCFHSFFATSESTRKVSCSGSMDVCIWSLMVFPISLYRTCNDAFNSIAFCGGSIVVVCLILLFECLYLVVCRRLCYKLECHL